MGDMIAALITLVLGAALFCGAVYVGALIVKHVFS